jgi:hypothetical protein
MNNKTIKKKEINRERWTNTHKQTENKTNTQKNSRFSNNSV